MICENTITIKYIFAHNYDSLEGRAVLEELWKTLNLTDLENHSWKFVRYELENKWLYITKQERADSFFVGYFEENFASKTAIEDSTSIAKDQKIILQRKPMPVGFQFYVPSDRIEDVIAEACETNKEKKKYHASVFGTSSMPVPTNPNYQCNKCFGYGHFRRYCQVPVQISIEDSLEMVRKPLPTGIPLNRFKVIQNPEEAKQYSTKSNIFYFDKKDNNEITYYVENRN